MTDLQYFYTAADTALIAKLKHLDQWVCHALWEVSPLIMVATLLDIYAGHFPDVYSERDEEKVNLLSAELVRYCKVNDKLLPATQERTKDMEQYEEEIKRLCFLPVFGVVTKEIPRASLYEQYVQRQCTARHFTPVTDSPPQDQDPGVAIRPRGAKR